MAKYESNSEVMYQDLLKRFNETRRLNIKLLEEKRELLLRIQSGNCADARPVNVNDGFASSFDIADCSDHCIYNSTEGCEKLTERNTKLGEEYEALISDYKRLETDFNLLKEETQVEREENFQLRELIEKLSKDLETFKKPVITHQANATYSDGDVEALKQQMLTYKEDFDQERKDKEKSLIDKEALEGRLKDANNRLQRLSLENMQYKQSLHHVKQQKDHLLSEMRRLSTSSLPFSPVLESFVPIDERFSRDNSDYQDIIPKSKGPNIKRSLPSDFKGVPAYEDLSCC